MMKKMKKVDRLQSLAMNRNICVPIAPLIFGNMKLKNKQQNRK